MYFIIIHLDAAGADNEEGFSLLVTPGGRRLRCSVMGMTGDTCHLLRVCYLLKKKLRKVPQKKMFLE